MNAFLLAAIAISTSPTSTRTAASASVAPAQIDPGLEITGSSVAARLFESRLTVPVTIAGRGPFAFLVDSGADRTVISVELASRLQLPTGSTARVNGVTGADDVPTAVLSSLHLGRSDVPEIIAPALPERFIGAAGILGIDALADERVALDYERRSITIQDARAPAQTVDGEIVVTARRRHGQLIMTQVRLAGVQVSAVVDTGSQISVGNSALLERLRLKRRLSNRIPIEVTGVTGLTAVAQAYPVKPLDIGPLTLDPAAIAFADFPPFALFGLADRPALLLGADVLSSFGKVSLDFLGRKVRFHLRIKG